MEVIFIFIFSCARSLRTTFQGRSYFSPLMFTLQFGNFPCFCGSFKISGFVGGLGFLRSEAFAGRIIRGDFSRIMGMRI